MDGGKAISQVHFTAVMMRENQYIEMLILTYVLNVVVKLWLKKNFAPTAAHEWTVTVMINLLLAFIAGANFGALVMALFKGGDG